MKLGTIENPIRILVADNWGADASTFLKNAFPNVKFSVYRDAKSDHPHGHMVAECICHMLPYDVHAEIVFHPYITLQRDEAANWMDVIKAEREAGRPFHIANCSFGMHHQDNDLYRTLLGGAWDDPDVLVEANDKIGDTIVLFASGNEDSSKRGKADMDNDVNYPQKALSKMPNVYVIGACDERGVPSTFSSDGKEVFAMYLGEGVVTYDPITHKVVKVDGTSFAAPFATGNVAENMCRGITVKENWYKSYVIAISHIAQGWIRGEQHRKAGYGCMLPVMFEKDYFQTYYINHIGAKNLGTTYLDYEPV